MQSLEVRQSFLDFFRRHHHELVRSSPLVPQNDPTLLFTNAGMVQFKDVFTGRETRSYKRATSSQKCVRAGGKHNDLENVGRTARHHTFFEMLGNFSFGDYFKADAIEFAWNWLTREIKLDASRLIITVFGGDESLPGIGADDEARALWRKVSGLSDDRIIGLGKADNFWMMGDTGPQGPCSEIHYCIGDLDYGTFGREPTPSGIGWVEVWNLVFMQFERAAKDAPLAPLPKPSIDTGAGLERVCAVVQGVSSNYDTDLLQPLVQTAAEMAQKKYGQSMNDDDVSMRVLADHARSTAFLMADGVNPSNEGRGYVLRRIMRRAIRHGVRLGLQEGAFAQICAQVVARMAPVFPELGSASQLILRATNAEDESFRRTIGRGMKLLDEEIAHLKPGQKVPSRAVAVLDDTHGFPIDLTRTIAEEKGFVVDEEEARKEKTALQPESAFDNTRDKAVETVYKALREELGATEFLGYHTTEAVQPIDVLLVKQRRVEAAETGEEVEVIARATPFYGEAGGQIGDTGRIHGGGFDIEVTDTQKPGGDLIVHRGKVVKGRALAGHSSTFTVDTARRDAIRGNHSATHLLHWALRKILGDHVTQKGSLVAPDRLRFDFAHFTPMSEEEKRRVEDLVNVEVLRNQDAQVTETSFDEARKLGAMALFGEKYGDRVRVMRIGENSIELCGGTHVRRAGDIGLFKIVSEAGIAQGIRRIEALTGRGALEYVQKLEDELGRAAEKTRVPLFKVVEQIEKMQKDLRDRERKIEELQRKMAMGPGRDILSQAREVNGIKVLSARSEVGDPKALREVADQLRNKLGSGVVVLGGVADGKVAIVAAVTADLTDKYNAGKIVSAVSSAVGGKGGGRADMAQGGGPQAEKLDEALESVFKLLS